MSLKFKIISVLAIALILCAKVLIDSKQELNGATSNLEESVKNEVYGTVNRNESMRGSISPVSYSEEFNENVVIENPANKPDNSMPGNNSYVSNERFKTNRNSENSAPASQNTIPGYSTTSRNSLSPALRSKTNLRRAARMRTDSIVPGIRSKREVDLSPEVTRTLPEAKVDQPYCVSLDAQWGQAPHNFRLTRGSVPKGLRFDSTEGTICGTPEEEAVALLVFNVSDARSDTTNLTFRLVVSIEEESEDSSEIRILNTFLTPGTIGSNYVENLEVSGGVEPVRWESSDLPAGIDLEPFNGLLGGIPEETGEFQITLRVVDFEEQEAFASLQLVIRPSPLFITTGSLGAYKVGEQISIFLDAQGGEPPYQWNVISGGLPEGIEFDNLSGSVFGRSLEEFDSVIRFEVRDQIGDSDRVDLPFVITPAELSIETKDIPVATVGEDFLYQFESLGGVPPYSWNIATGLPNEFVLSPNGLLSGFPTLPGEATFTISVTDQTGLSESREFNLTIESTPLRVVSRNVPVMLLCDDYFAELEAKGGLPPYNWRFVSGNLPNGVSLTEFGEISGSVDEDLSGSFVARVIDANNKKADRNIIFTVQNLDLVITSPLVLEAGIVRQEYSETLRASGACEGSNWSVSSGTLPPGINLETDGRLSGVPTESGDFTFDITVQDGIARAKTSSFIIVIAPEDLILNSQIISSGRANQQFSHFFSASGGVPPYSWSLNSGELPPGLVLHSSTGELFGVPTDPGSFNFGISVSDAGDLNDIEDFNLEIEPAPLNITTGLNDLSDGAVGENYEFNLSVEGGVSPYAWSIVSGELPPGIALSQQGSINGVPTSPGNYSFFARVTDSDAEIDTQELLIDVIGEELSIVTPLQLPDAQVGVLYSEVLQAVGGAPPYQWFLISGTLPEGLSLNPGTGVLQGTPTTSGSVNDLIIAVEDSVASQQSATFSLLVIPNDMAPVVNLNAAASDKTVGLVWEKPNRPEFVSSKIVRNSSRFPVNPGDGVEIYFGNENNFVDTNLLNDTQYFYAAFAYYGEFGFAELGASAQSTAIPHTVSITGPNDPFADQLISFNPLDPNDAFGSDSLPQIVLGAPAGTGEFFGSTDVVSIHAKANEDGGQSAPYGGSITLGFDDNIVVNGPGADFTVFENAFRLAGTDTYWMEPAVVEVSADGLNFYRFPFDFVPHFDDEGGLDLRNPFSYSSGFAGVKPVFSNAGTPDPTNPALSGGDQFDLSAITEVNLSWIRFVRIISTGDNWLIDVNGDPVRHISETGALDGTATSGFDLDAITAVNY